MVGAETSQAEAAVLDYLAPRVRQAVAPALPRVAGEARWLEVRLRLGRPLQLLTEAGECWPPAAGPTSQPHNALCCCEDDLARTLQLVTRASVYAWEDELARGFCTLPGGHRVGLAGRGLCQRGRVVGQKAFGSINIRLAHPVQGCADAVVAALRGRVGSLLIFGPPGCGKTTLLRDLCRQFSTGRPEFGLRPRRVAIVDERSEIAACADGRPAFDLGPRADVLDGIPKAIGLSMAIRAMGPEVVACDEIGGPGDAQALADAARCGVTVLATAHAGGVEDLYRRPAVAAALRGAAFGLAVGLDAHRTLAAVQPLAAAGAALGGVRRWRLS